MKTRLTDNLYSALMEKTESIAKGELVRSQGKINVVDILKLDMLNFLLYLALADGEVQMEEIKYINQRLGYSFNHDTIMKYIARNHINAEEFLQKVPPSLPYFVRQSNSMGIELMIGSQGLTLKQLYMNTFHHMGRELIAANKTVEQREVDSLTQYGILLDVYAKQIQSADENTKVVLPYRPRRSGNVDDQTGGDDEKSEIAFSGTITPPKPDETLDSLYEQLMQLIGLESVKQEVGNIINLLKICKIRQEQGLQVPAVSRHLVFLGNPGTGKTTVARILARIYYALGILSQGQLVEVDRSGLVAGYMGQTEEKTKMVCEKAKGGVLFIDEAYALSNNRGEGDFGQQAIDILNKEMEDNREDLIVIAAGYEKEMNIFLNANPGLRSRFNKTITFPDYSAEELLTIFEMQAAKLDYHLDDAAKTYLQNRFASLLENPPENFGNARAVRNYLEEAISHQANRLLKSSEMDVNKLTLLSVEDLQHVKL